MKYLTVILILFACSIIYAFPVQTDTTSEYEYEISIEHFPTASYDYDWVYPEWKKTCKDIESGNPNPNVIYNESD